MTDRVARILLLTAGAGLGAVVAAGCGAGAREVPPAASSVASAASPPGVAATAQPDTQPHGTAGSLYGSWTPSDGTSTKVFDESGSCKGFFYVSSTGEPLDIGGPSTCQLSSARDSSGRYKFLVTQGPNEATYLVEFDGPDAATVFSKGGKQLYQLTRF